MCNKPVPDPKQCCTDTNAATQELVINVSYSQDRRLGNDFLTVLNIYPVEGCRHFKNCSVVMNFYKNVSYILRDEKFYWNPQL